MSSRHSGSSRHRSHHSKPAEGDTESLVEQVKTIVNLLYEVASSRPHEWETYLASARSAVTALERLRFFRDPARFAEQVWIIQGLQDFAYHDPDSGCIKDIVDFCQASWLRVLRNYPENVEVLSGKSQSLLGLFRFLHDGLYVSILRGSIVGSAGAYPGYLRYSPLANI
jgi:hypothetical protein